MRGLAQLGWTDGRNVRIDIPHLGASREVGSWHCQIPSWPSIVRQLSRWQSETKYRRWVFCRRPSDGAANFDRARAPRISRTQLREEMKMRNYKIAAAVIGSFVLGVGTASVLAQGTAPHYEVAEINVKDQTGYEASGVDKVRDAIKANGGKFIAGGYDKAKARTGAAVANRFLIVQYPSKGAADKTWTTIKEWWDTAGSKHAADFRNIEVEGVEQK
jgi:uncharacterized protein (DUF1330 family)